MKHRWNHNKDTGLSTCKNCDFTVKTYRVKHGGIAPCNPEAPPTPQCQDSTTQPPLACTECSGRLAVRKCDRMRAYHVANTPNVEE